MKTTRNTTSGKRTIFAPSGIVLLIMILFWIIGGQKSFGQGVGISEVLIVPDGSSILELRSTVRGFLAPRMTTADRVAIASPAQGLLVYDTTTESFWYFEGSWKTIASGTLGSPNQILGMNGAGTANEYKTLLGTANQINVNLTVPGQITLSTPQDIHTGATPTFSGLTILDGPTQTNILNDVINVGNALTDIIDLTGITNINGGNLTLASPITYFTGATVNLTDGTTTNINSNVVNIGNAITDAVTISGTVQPGTLVAGQSAIVFDGATPDAVNRTTFNITNPTAPRTINFPDRTGTVVLSQAGSMGNNLAVSTDATGQLVNAVDGQPFNVESDAVNIGDDITDAVDITGVTNINGGNLTLASPQTDVNGTTLNVSDATTVNINSDMLNLGNAVDDAITIQGATGVTGNSLTVGTTVTDLNSTTTNVSGTTANLASTTTNVTSGTTNVTGAAINIGDGAGDLLDITAATNINGGNLTVASPQTDINSGSINIGDAASDLLDITAATNINGGNLTVDAPVSTINSGVIILGTDATDNISLNGEIQNASPLILEGLTDDNFETTIAVTNPTQDNIITLPDRTGTVVLSQAGAMGNNLAVSTDATGQLVNAVDGQPFNVESDAVNIGDDITDVVDITGGTNLNGGNVTIADGATTTSINNNTINLGNAVDDAITILGATGVTGNSLTVGTTVTDLNSATTNVTGSAINLGDGATDVIDLSGVTNINSGNLTVTSPQTDVTSSTTNITGSAINIGDAASDLLDITAATNINGGNLTVDAPVSTINSGVITIGTDANDNISLNGEIQNASPLILEGLTDDGFETTIAVTDPTQDNTITLPNRTGTVVLSQAGSMGNNLAVSTDATGQLVNAVDGQPFNVESDAVNIGDDITDAVDITGVTNINGGNLTLTSPQTDVNGTTLNVSDATTVNINSDMLNLGNAVDDAITIQGATGVTGNSLTVGTTVTDLNSATTNVTGSAINLGDASTDVIDLSGVTNINSGNLTVTSPQTDVTSSTTNITGSAINLGDASTDALDITAVTNINGGDLTIDAPVTTVNSGVITLGTDNTDNISLNGEIQNASPLILEGLTDDNFETTIAVTNPTQDNIITLPDRTGTVVLSQAGSMGNNLAVSTDATGQLVNAVDGQPFNVESDAVNIGDDITDVVDITGGTNLNGGNVTIADGATTTSINNNTINLGNAVDDAITILGATGVTGNSLTVGTTVTDLNSTTTNVSGTTANLASTTTNVTSGTTNVTGAGINIGDAASDLLDITAATNINGGNLTVDAPVSTINSGVITIGTDANDNISLNGEIQNASPLILEGLTDDGFETTIAVTDPTQDNTITLPNRTGTVVLSQAGSMGNNLAVSTDATGQLVNAVDGQPFNVESDAVNIGDDITDAVDITGVTNINGGNLTLASPQTDVNGTTLNVSDATTVNINSDMLNLGNAVDDAITIQGATGVTGNSITVGTTVTDLNSTTTNVSGTTANLASTTTNVTSGTTNVTGAAINIGDGAGDLLDITAATNINGGNLTVASPQTDINSGSINIGDAASDLLDITAATNINGGNLTVDAPVSTINSGVIILGTDATDNISLNGEIQNASPLILEGLTDDNFETTIAVTNPTQDNIITLPDRTGTVVLSQAGAMGNNLAVSTDATGQLVNAVDGQPFNVESDAVNIGDDITDVVDITGGTNLNGGNVTIADGATTTSINNNTINLGNAVDDAITILGATGVTGNSLTVGTTVTDLNSATTNVTGSAINLGDGATDVIDLSGVTNINSGNLTVTSPQTDVTSSTTNITGSAINIGDAASDLLDITAATNINGGNLTVDAPVSTINSGVITIGTDANDNISLNGEIQNASPLILEGLTDDGFETTIAVTDPTQDNTITLPNRTGTVVLSQAGSMGNNLAVSTDATGQLVNAVDGQPFNVESDAVNIGDDITDAVDITGVTNINGGNLTLTSPQTDVNGTTLNVSDATTVNINSDMLNLGNAVDDAITIQGATGVTGNSLTVGTTVTDLNSATTNVTGSAINLGDASTDVIDLSGVTNINSGNLTVTSPQTDVTSSTTNITGSAINLGDASTDALDITAVTNINGGDLTIDAPVTTVNSGVITLGTDNTDNISLNGEIQNASPLILEGLTDDNFETTIAVTNPTQDNIITLPDRTGTVVLSQAGAMQNDLAVSTDATGQLVNAVNGQNFNINSDVVNIGNSVTDAIDITGVTNLNGGQVTAVSNFDATNGLDVSGAAFTVTNQVITQTGTGQVSFSGNVDAGSGVDVTGNVTATGDVMADQLTSTIATGTPPIIVTSTTPVANLSIGGNAATATLASTVTTNANLTGPITSVGNTTSIASQTGIGTKFVVDDSPTLITPNLGVATATSINGNTITAGTGTLTIAAGKTLNATDNATVSGSNTGDQTITLTGDVSGSGTGSFATTLANSGVTANTYGSATTVPVLAVDAKGRVTSVTNTIITGTSPLGSALTSANIIVGNGSNLAAAVPMTGDISITNGGLTAIVTDAVTTGKIADSNVTYDKIQDVSSTDVVLGRESAGSGIVEEISTTGSGSVVRATSPTLVTPNLGTPSALVGTNITGTAAGLTAGTVTTNANLTGPITSVGNTTSIASQTGIGTKFVVDDSPTLITPNLGAATATSVTATGLLSGSQLTSTIATGTPPIIVTSTTPVANLSIGGNAATATLASTVTTNANLTGPITSVGNTTSIASQTGIGTKFVVDDSPTLITPNLGVATATSINGNTITAGTGTLTIAAGKTLNATDNATVSGSNTGDQTITLTGDVSGSGTGSFATTLANSGVTANTYGSATTVPVLAVDAKGRVTSVTNTIITGTSPLGSALTSANIIVGNGSNLAAAVPMTGDISITNGGLTAIVTDAVTTGKIADSNVTYDKIQDVSSTDVVLGRESAGSGIVEEISTTGSGSVVRATSPTLVTPNLGTPSALVGTNITGTAAGLTAGTVTTNANLTGPITSVGNTTSIASQTGIGTKFVVDDSPTLITPNLGAATATSVTATGLLSGSQLTSTIATGTPPIIVTSTTPVANLSIGGNAATATLASTVTTNANLTGPITSVGNTTSIASQTGIGTKFVVDDSPTLITPNLGVATATSINGNTITAGTGTLTIAAGKTLNATDNATVSGSNTGDQTITLTGDVSGSGTGSFATTLANSGVTANTYGSATTVPVLAVDAKGRVTSVTNTIITGTSPLGSALTSANIIVGNGSNLAAAVPMTGDISITNGGLTAIVTDAVTTGKIADSNVTYDKIQDVSSTDVVLGRESAGSGIVEEISTTGSGSVVRATSPTLVTPNLGTPSALVGTNITGTAAGLTAGTVTTNANLTGPITSVGNTTSIASQTGIGTKFVVDDSPTLITPNLGAATATSVTATGLLSGSQLTSTIATGTPPIIVTSTTPVANLSIGGNAATATAATTAGSFSGNLAGDVTGPQGTTVVANVGGVTAANVASGANLANAATNANTASAIVKRDASGDFTATNITANLLGNATTATTASSFSGNLAGDVTGPQGTTVVANVGSVTAANVATGANLANASTNANTANAIVKRDASGNFSAGNITANITGNVSGSSGSTTGNAATATKLATARNINGVAFDGSADITIAATNIAGGTLGAIPYQSAANTTTILTASTTANKVLMSGASAAPVWSTPTFPNVSVTSRKIIVSDGTNWVPTTETYAVPGASGNLLVSDGTNWISTLPTFNQNTTGTAANVTGVVAIANGGTNNGSLGVTAGGIVYADGGKLMTTATGASGNVLISNGTGIPTWQNQSTGFTGGSRNNVVPINSTRYAPLTGNVTPQAADNVAGTRTLMWRGGTIKNLYVKLGGNPGGGVNNTITIWVNGVATALAVTINNTDSGNNVATSISVAAGDEVGVRIVTGNGGSAVEWSWACEFNY